MKQGIYTFKRTWNKWLPWQKRRKRKRDNRTFPLRPFFFSPPSLPRSSSQKSLLVFPGRLMRQTSISCAAASPSFVLVLPIYCPSIIIYPCYSSLPLTRVINLSLMSGITLHYGFHRFPYHWPSNFFFHLSFYFSFVLSFHVSFSLSLSSVFFTTFDFFFILLFVSLSTSRLHLLYLFVILRHHSRLSFTDFLSWKTWMTE